MRRFFVEPENIVGAGAVLTGAEARHIATVLRLTPGAGITLFDGSGSYYEALLTRVAPARVEAKIIRFTPYIEANEAGRSHLHLGIGLLKGKKMDLVIQKSTELGIHSVRPFRSQYSTVYDATEAKLSRWQKIGFEACKQSNQPKPPLLHEVTDFLAILSGAGEEQHQLRIIFWEEPGQKTLGQILGAINEVKSALVLIGPEGGFSSEEVAAATAAGFEPASLGGRILRAETAAIAAVAILQHELGNLV